MAGRTWPAISIYFSPHPQETVSRVRSWFDRSVLNEPFILREPQDEHEQLVEGLTTNGQQANRNQ